MLQIYGFLSVEQKIATKKTIFLVGLTGLPTLLTPYAGISPGNKDALTQIPPKGDVARSCPTPTRRGQRQQKTVIRATEYSGLYLRSYGVRGFAKQKILFYNEAVRN